MELAAPFQFQGYELSTDNFYSSPSLFDALLKVRIQATGTLRTNRTGVPDSWNILEDGRFLTRGHFVNTNCSEFGGS